MRSSVSTRRENCEANCPGRTSYPTSNTFLLAARQVRLPLSDNFSKHEQKAQIVASGLSYSVAVSRRKEWNPFLFGPPERTITLGPSSANKPERSDRDSISKSTLQKCGAAMPPTGS